MKLINSIKVLYHKYKHGWVLSYFFIYMLWFSALEKSVTTDYTPVHIWIDNLIPFNELFVIPYFIWFFYIAAAIVYFFLTSKEDFYKCCAFLFIGMTVCLIIYTIWPNGQNLRPSQFTRDNIFVDLVKRIYRIDTSTNVFPSIHVLNSIGVHISITNSTKLKNRTLIRNSSFLLAILISLSTVFLKQHSVLDGMAAILLGVLLYFLIYVPDYSKYFHENTSSKEEYGFEN